jgi:hypothetical protein
MFHAWKVSDSEDVVINSDQVVYARPHAARTTRIVFANGDSLVVEMAYPEIRAWLEQTNRG